MLDPRRVAIFHEIDQERARQDSIWGEQNHPIVVPIEAEKYADKAAAARAWCDEMAQRGMVTWADILLEETFEALSETDADRQREELVQVVAVAVAMIEYIDRMRGR